MKKVFYKSIMMMSMTLMIQATQAQTVSEFENFNLSPGSYLDGSSQPGGMIFNDGNAEFPNYYDPSFQYWQSGWAISNMQDTVTAGFANMYAAASFMGVNNSATYAVGQQNATIALTGSAAGKVVNGFYLTNSTYAYISMRDGDAFAKKFGGVTGNDPDYFKIIIRNWYNGTLSTDSVEFYLADYRFSNNALDYIVKNWQWVDLTSLGNSDSLLFTLSSTDVGSFGINTPLFFCIDNFTTADSPVGIADLKYNDTKIQVYPNPVQSELVVSGVKAESKIIFTDINGKTILTNTINSDFRYNVSQWPAGMYFISVISGDGFQTGKFIKE
ncbi:MAG: DUF4465 domain-containing protein [Bacteroidetes bacterium]|jgi:hypothetical protein|nr:DUF4465 domain-containing protein [Bacteroidota bacterium]